MLETIAFSVIERNTTADNFYCIIYFVTIWFLKLPILMANNEQNKKKSHQ